MHDPLHPDFEAFREYIADTLFDDSMIMMDDFIPEAPQLIASDCV